MNFDESVKYLYDLGNEVLAMKLGLDNIGKLLDALGKPHEKYLKVQIAGTNGKGSTVAFLEAICLQAGIKIGATTSPHLISVTERVRIGGTEISETDFARHASMVRETSEKLVEHGELETVPTYFEQVTAIALNVFADAGIELAILETGLGGRFDATTAARAEIIALTPIDYDHQRILGDTLAEIAAEKAAIITGFTKIAIAAPQKEADIINEIWLKCEENDLEPVWATTNLGENVSAHQLLKEGVDFNSRFYAYKGVTLSLAGRHQFTNAVLALTIAEFLPKFNFNVTQENIVQGLKSAKHSGRLEFYKGILFDGAHNISGAKALREFLDETIKQPIIMIFGAMRDKNLTEIAGILFPKVEKLIFTVPDNPRSMQADEFLNLIPKDFPPEKINTTENVGEALKIAREISSADELICVTGSLYLVGEAQKILSED